MSVHIFISGFNKFSVEMVVIFMVQKKTKERVCYKKIKKMPHVQRGIRNRGSHQELDEGPKEK